MKMHIDRDASDGYRVCMSIRPDILELGPSLICLNALQG
jgi:ferredoxin